MAGNPAYCGCDSFVPFGPQYPRSAPSGWWNQGFPGCAPSPCNNPGPCPIQLDFQCIIYHKDNNSVNNLGPIGLNNGATLQLFAETIAPPVGLVLNVPNYTIPYLRSKYTITNIQQLIQDVDIELGLQSSAIAGLTTLIGQPIGTNNTPAINLAASGPNGHTLTATLELSATTPNQASILSDGLYVAPQNLAYNTSTKALSISDGNSVSLASLVCGVIGFLGNVATDPTGNLDGQYWYNTTSNLLKIQVNGVIKTITTS
jgi:hypothetical protein